MDQARQLLNSSFGLADFRPGQQQVIEALLAGESSLAVFPTGGGKSLCYQLPALMFEGLTLVVSPLIALMKDQVDYLQSRNIAAARFDSSLNLAESQQLYQNLQNGQVKILYIAPERLSNERFVNRIRHLNIALLAVDEAHCISDWGHNFRPDYLKLANVAQQLKVQRVLALTATATPAVSKDICQRFFIKPQHHVQTGFYRSNLNLHINPQAEARRAQVLLARLQNTGSQAAIVYVTLQKTAEQVAEFLVSHQLNAAAYHAGMKTELRTEVQEQFMAGNIHIVVATIAFGMGIDKADIRAVYHYNLPKALENYMQEVGRAGRDGLPAHCELLAGAEDAIVLENFTYGDTPDVSALAGVIQWLDQQTPEFSLSTYTLGQRFDIRPLVLDTLLTYLELAKVIKATAPFYSVYKIKSSQPLAAICGQFNQQRSDFLSRLFASGNKGRIWLSIDLEHSEQQLNEPKQRIMAALNYLEQQEQVELQVTGLQKGYQRLSQALSSEQLTLQQQALFSQREQRDIARLQQVFTWIESQHCYNQVLMQYFGEAMPQPCGHCSYCAGEGAKRLGIASSVEPDLALMQSIAEQQGATLNSARKLTRFLCGISSPRLIKSKLSHHVQFGLYTHIHFAKVLEQAQRLF